VTRLVLLRHAKSSWDTPGLEDHERPLARRGSRAVAALRRHVAAGAVAPDLVLCSTARRAVETWEGIASAFPSDIQVEFTAGLYGATAEELLGRLRQVPEGIECVLVVGHNPGLEDLATGLVGRGDDERRRRLETKFPTGALATLVVPVPWAELGWGDAELVDYVVPRDLVAADTE
jgi:phosphohistidine phosphatase